MILYHGSNVVVDKPQLLQNSRALDFGRGFYLTSDLHQAQKWAKLVLKRRGNGQAIVNYYQFDENQTLDLTILRFEQANGDWLDFVVSNRKFLQAFDYDIVIGAVANDNTLPVIDDYMDGRYTKDEAVRRLLPQKLTDQYAFCTQKALSHLIYQGYDNNE